MSSGTVLDPVKITSAATCVQWIVEEPHTLTRAWCTDLINFVNKTPAEGRVSTTFYIFETQTLTTLEYF